MMRVGQRNCAGRKLIGYNVYHAPDGATSAYYGFVNSLRSARRIAAHGSALAESLWDTSRKANHCAGLTAPTGDESGEPVAWFGTAGWDCAVAVWE